MGIAHITGGGVWHKFGEILPKGVGAIFDNMLEPALVLKLAQEMSWNIPDLKLTDKQVYGTFHGGYGMMVICADNSNALTLTNLARRHEIYASYIGHTTESKENEIIIHSKFKEGKILSSLDE
ncbi:hypothetical protein KAI92_04115 [Candidatus Parcubacteria bacterium]|nr:hypothetical protein [Candidatus Parcubacteria bacterium]